MNCQSMPRPFSAPMMTHPMMAMTSTQMMPSNTLMGIFTFEYMRSLKGSISGGVWVEGSTRGDSFPSFFIGDYFLARYLRRSSATATMITRPCTM